MSKNYQLLLVRPAELLLTGYELVHPSQCPQEIGDFIASADKIIVVLINKLAICSKYSLTLEEILNRLSVETR